MLSKLDLENCEIEIVKVNLKRSEYEDKIVRLVRALLEIDELMSQVDDAVAISKEAA